MSRQQRVSNAKELQVVYFKCCVCKQVRLHFADCTVCGQSVCSKCRVPHSDFVVCRNCARAMEGV